MQLRTSTPRENWRDIVESQGLTYACEPSNPGGPDVRYWNESQYFAFDEQQIDYLEGVTQDLHDMALSACREMAKSPQYIALFDVPFQAEELIARSFDENDNISLYGRFDLAWDGAGPAKLLEYNADTPAALLEAAVVQWMWLEDLFPEKDQWNMIHERLLQAWNEYRPMIPGGVVHFAAGQDEPSEDWATIAYLRDTAREAGLQDFGITMEEIGWDASRNMFVDGANVDIHTIFKMYPWEWLLNEQFGRYVMSNRASTRWIEPAWKMLAGSKALLAKLWEMYPDHPNLLPAYLERPEWMNEYVAKPILGWEGAGIRIVTRDGETVNAPAHTEGQREIFQQYVPLPKFDGKHVVLGTWIINGHAAGLGIRQSTSRITDTNAEFVPHLINTNRSSAEQVQAWLTNS